MHLLITGACQWVLVAALLGALLLLRRSYRRKEAAYSAQVAALERLANERGTALDYIVRARVVSYTYEYVGYQVVIGGEQRDEVNRVMIFSPPEHKDIICKRITLAEGQKAVGATSVHDFGFEAAVYKPLPDLVDDDTQSGLDPYDKGAWQFESHPWILDVPPEETGEVRTILVFTPMISETRRLTVRYCWPSFFPRLYAGALTTRGHFTILKHARVLEFTIKLPDGAPRCCLTLHPPGRRDPIESMPRDDALVCSLTNANRGTYRYVITLDGPLSARGGKGVSVGRPPGT